MRASDYRGLGGGFLFGCGVLTSTTLWLPPRTSSLECPATKSILGILGITSPGSGSNSAVVGLVVLLAWLNCCNDAAADALNCALAS